MWLAGAGEREVGCLITACDELPRPCACKINNWSEVGRVKQEKYILAGVAVNLAGHI